MCDDTNTLKLKQYRGLVLIIGANYLNPATTLPRSSAVTVTSLTVLVGGMK